MLPPPKFFCRSGSVGIFFLLFFMNNFQLSLTYVPWPSNRLPPRHLSLDQISANYTQHIKHQFFHPIQVFSLSSPVLHNGTPVLPGAQKECWLLISSDFDLILHLIRFFDLWDFSFFSTHLYVFIAITLIQAMMLTAQVALRTFKCTPFLLLS